MGEETLRIRNAEFRMRNRGLVTTKKEPLPAEL